MKLDIFGKKEIKRLSLEIKALKTACALSKLATKRAISKANERQKLIDDLADIIFKLKNNVADCGYVETQGD